MRKISTVIIVSVFLCLLSHNRLESIEEDSLRVEKVEIVGNNSLSNSKLQSVMDTRSKGVVDKVMFWKRAPIFDELLLENDIERIINLYQKEGFLNPIVHTPAINIDEKKQKVDIKIEISEGVRTSVSNIEFLFPDNDDDSAAIHTSSLKKKLLIKEGHYFRDEYFKKDLEYLQDYFEDIGYPYVKVDYKLSLSEDETTVTIIYTIKTGALSFLGEVNFDGIYYSNEKLLRKYLTIHDGDKYDPKSIEKTRRALQGLGLFQYVNVNVKLDNEPEALPVDIILRENDNYDLKFGVGYGVEEHFRVYTELSKLHFLGGLRKGTLYLKHSALEPINIDFKLIQPGFPTVYSATTLNPFYRKENEPGYEIERVGGNITLQQRLSNFSSTYLTYTFENNHLRSSAELPTDELSIDSERAILINILKEEELLRNYRKSSITWRIARDSSEPKYYPDRGSLLSNSITLSGLGFNSDFRFFKLVPEARAYKSLKKNYVVALRLKAGYLKSLKENDYIPIEERFYAGGSHSVRGWARSRLGPMSDENQPLGGKSLIDGSIELRTPLWKELTTVWFIDYGQVNLEELQYDLSDLHYAAGGGLRYSTPFGPIRLDIASPVGDESKKIQFFISLGQAF